jgi:biopolymer transport protein ExbD
MVTRASVPLALLPMFLGCGPAADRPEVLVRISSDSQCSLKGQPANCDTVGAWIVKELANAEYDVHICAHKRARYERVAAAMDSIRDAGFRRIEFIEADPETGMLCTGDARTQ